MNRHLCDWLPPHSFVTLVAATLDPAHLNKDIVSDVGLLGDAKLTLQALIGELRQTIKSNRDCKDTVAEIAAVRAEALKLTGTRAPLAAAAARLSADLGYRG